MGPEVRGLSCNVDEAKHISDAMKLAMMNAALDKAEVALGQRPEHHHALRQPAAAPLHAGEAQLAAAARRGQARRIAAVVAVGGEAVDVHQ